MGWETDEAEKIRCSCSTPLFYGPIWSQIYVSPYFTMVSGEVLRAEKGEGSLNQPVHSHKQPLLPINHY